MNMNMSAAAHDGAQAQAMELPYTLSVPLHET